MDCLFCKIVKGEIPSYKVYESADVLAFLDIKPCSKGHTVVIPKKHFATVAEMDEANWQKLNAGLLQAAKKVESVLRPDGLNVGLNNGPAAGQAIAHLHWHIIPRFINDGGGSMHSIVKSGEVDVEAVAKLFKN